MNGQSLTKYLNWLDGFITGEERFISDDIDYFIPLLKKKNWTLSGIALLSLAHQYISGKNGVSCLLIVSLRMTKHPGKIPKQFSLALLNGVSTPPTLVLERHCFYSIGLKNYGYTIRALDPIMFRLPNTWHITYYEKRYQDLGISFFDRFLVIDILP